MGQQVVGGHKYRALQQHCRGVSLKAASPGSCLCPQVCRLSSPTVHIAAHETVHPAYHCLEICIRSIFKQLNCSFRNSLWKQTRRLLFISCFMTVFGKQRIRQFHLASPSNSCVSFYCLPLLFLAVNALPPALPCTLKSSSCLRLAACTSPSTWTRPLLPGQGGCEG